jgi:hypothetical protein
MSWLTDLLQGIQLNPVLRERLALAEQKFKDIETENKHLTEKVAAITKENETLRQQIEQAPVAGVPPKEKPQIWNGLYYFGGDVSVMYCPRCYERENKKHVMAEERGVGHICTVCEKFISSP